jgi:hypothetical protein
MTRLRDWGAGERQGLITGQKNAQLSGRPSDTRHCGEIIWNCGTTARLRLCPPQHRRGGTQSRINGAGAARGPSGSPTLGKPTPAAPARCWPEHRKKDPGPPSTKYRGGPGSRAKFAWGQIARNRYGAGLIRHPVAKTWPSTRGLRVSCNPLLRCLAKRRCAELGRIRPLMDAHTPS